MKSLKLLSAGLLMAATTVMGCSDTATSKKEPAKGSGTAAAPAPKKEEAHSHGAGPNGGVLMDLGKYHAEFTVDHPTKSCTLLVIGDDEKTPVAVAATEFTLTTKETKTKEGTVVAPMTIKLIPKDNEDGKTKTFVGTDEGLGNVADFEGTIIGEIDGKPSQGTFKEESH